MKKITAYVLICLMIINIFGTVAFAEDNKLGDAKDTLLQLVSFVRTFKDATEHWANKFIAKLYDSGFIKGYPDGTFRPDNPIKRGEFTKIFITSVTGEDPGNSTEDHWAQNYIKAAVNGGYLKPEEFASLDKNITRAEIAMMISRALDVQPNNVEKLKNNITDFSSISNKYKEHIARVYAAGIVTGYEDGSFRPDGEASRAEASTMVVRFLDESERRVPKLKEEPKIVIDGEEIPVENKEIIPYYIKVEEIIKDSGLPYLSVYNGDDTISLSILPKQSASIHEEVFSYVGTTKGEPKERPQYIQIYHIEGKEYYNVAEKILKEFYPNSYDEVLEKFKSMKWSGKKYEGEAEGRKYLIDSRATFTAIRIGR